MEILVEEEVENNKIKIFSKEFIDKYDENHKIILRRLKKEFELLDKENINYKISVNPIRKKSLNYHNIVQIELNYLNYNLYIFIPEIYPFERPLLLMDKLSIDERKYRIQDGLEETKIDFLHNYISEFVVDTKVDDLICIKEFVENKFVEPSNVNEIDPRRVYYKNFGKYFSPVISLFNSYKIMVEGIDLALGIY